MDKKTVVIASVLKPITDSRNYEKTAISINLTGKYQVYVVGQPVRSIPMGSSIRFNALFTFPRLSIKRLFVGWVFFSYLLKIKPHWVMVTTFELLLPAILYKILKGGKLTYDVQENYFRNLWYGNSFPFGIKHLLAIKIRLLENLTRPFINHYYLAEKNYEKEFSFSKNKSTVLENKLRKASVKERIQRNDGLIQMVYTGTISESYGIFNVVKLVKLLHEKEPTIRLVIIGYAAQKTCIEKLRAEINSLDYISLVGGEELVSHHDILQAIRHADFGFISYRPNKSTENCIPTKLYEYLAHQLPYLYPTNEIWSEITKIHQGGFEVNFEKPDVNEILEKIRKEKFYTNTSQEDIYWQDPKWEY